MRAFLAWKEAMNPIRSAGRSPTIRYVPISLGYMLMFLMETMDSIRQHRWAKHFLVSNDRDRGLPGQRVSRCACP